VSLCKKMRMEPKVCKKCKKFPVGDLQIDLMQIVKDDTLILTAHASLSCSLQNSSILIFVH